MNENDKFLLEATRRGDIGEVRRLLDAGANIFVTDETGQSLFDIAIENGPGDLLVFLIKYPIGEDSAEEILQARDEKVGISHELPTSPESAVIVESVHDEKVFLRTVKCECGRSGTVRMAVQALSLAISNKPMDILTCECTECGRNMDLYFDISEFFGKS